MISRPIDCAFMGRVSSKSCAPTLPPPFLLRSYIDTSVQLWGRKLSPTKMPSTVHIIIICNYITSQLGSHRALRHFLDPSSARAQHSVTTCRISASVILNPRFSSPRGRYLERGLLSWAIFLLFVRVRHPNGSSLPSLMGKTARDNRATQCATSARRRMASSPAASR